MIQRLMILSMSILILLSACSKRETGGQTPLILESSGEIVAEESQITSLNHPYPQPEILNQQPSSKRSLKPTDLLAPDNAVVTQTSDATATPIPDATAPKNSYPLPGATQAPVQLPVITLISLSSPTATRQPTATNRPTPTNPPTSTSPPQPGVISGQILLNGAPATRAVTLILEDQTYQVIREIVTSTGEFRFENLPSSAQGYNVLFALEKNPDFSFDEVAQWAWIGPIAVNDGDVIRLADMEISLLGFQPLHPPSDSILSVRSITPQTPLVFEWGPYPSADKYWLELRSGRTLQLVWQSGLLDTNTISFDGVLVTGENIPAGSYWWNISARKADANLTISGPLRSFFLSP
jgi:hypothetical protein